MLFTLSPMEEVWENKILQLNDKGGEMNISFSLSNQFRPFKYVGITLGYEVLRHGIQKFNDDGELYVDRYEMDDYMILSLDLIIP